MADTRMLRLFCTPVIVHEIDGAPELNKQLKRAIEARRKKHEGVRLSNRGGWQSDRHLLDWAGEAGRKLAASATALASEHAVRLDGSPARWSIDAWANANDTGGFNLPHVHGGTYWAAVYYVAMGKGGGGELVLHDPRMPALRMHAPSLRFKEAGPELRVTITPREGLLVMFPAWLYHSVEQWEGTGTRLSVAMNIRFAGA